MHKTTTQSRAMAWEERPREKMKQLGKHHLTDAELLALVLGSGTQGESALSLAGRMLYDHEHRLSGIGSRSVMELVGQYKGIGTVKAMRILAMLELGRRRREEIPVERPVIRCSKDSFSFLQPVLGELAYEEFWTILLNNANMIMHMECIGRGGMQSVSVDVRRVIKSALDYRATSVILGHNHPSGLLQPSQEDIRLTKTLKEAASLFHIKVLDHVIVADHAYYSFTDEGIL